MVGLDVRDEVATFQPRLRAKWNCRIPPLAVPFTRNRPDVLATERAIHVVEVISPQNAKDTWCNLPLYASLPTVTEILLVESTRVGAQAPCHPAMGTCAQDRSGLVGRSGVC